MSATLSSASWPCSAVTTAYPFCSSASRIISRSSSSSSTTSTVWVIAQLFVLGVSQVTERQTDPEGRSLGDTRIEARWCRDARRSPRSRCTSPARGQSSSRCGRLALLCGTGRRCGLKRRPGWACLHCERRPTRPRPSTRASTGDRLGRVAMQKRVSNRGWRTPARDGPGPRCRAAEGERSSMVGRDARCAARRRCARSCRADRIARKCISMPPARRVRVRSRICSIIRDMRRELARMRSSTRTDAGSVDRWRRSPAPMSIAASGIAQVVSQDRQEPLLELLVRGFSASAALSAARARARLLRPPALGQVARDLGEADELPSGSRRAVMTTLAQKREPSLRTRQPSSSKRPSRAATSSSCAGLPAVDVLLRVEARSAGR